MDYLNVYLPAFNESGNISALLRRWDAVSCKVESFGLSLRLHVVDDRSTDDTASIALQTGRTLKVPVEIISHKTNQGLWAGLNSSIAHFIKNAHSGDLMLLMDADNTHDPGYCLDMIKKLRESQLDCVIASRYQKHSDVLGLARHREWLSDLARLYYRWVLRVPAVEDYTCGYRVYSYDVVHKLALRWGANPIQERSFACMMELLYKLHQIGAKFGEVGFVLRYDQKVGQSKMKVLKTMVRSILVGARLRVRRQPEQSSLNPIL